MFVLSVLLALRFTSLGEERANLSAFRTFVRFVLVSFCRFPLPHCVFEGLRFVIVVLPGLFSYLFYSFETSLFILIQHNFANICSVLLKGPPWGSEEQGNNVIYYRRTGDHKTKKEGNRTTKVISGSREHRKLRF